MTASQLAAASAASFLPRLTLIRYGVTNLGGDQPDGVAVLPEQRRPVVDAGAAFHADQRRRRLRDQCRQIFPRHLRFDQQQLAIIINGVHRKYVLGEVDSYRDNARGLPLPWP